MRPDVVLPKSYLVGRRTTYSKVYVGYIFSHGIQEILFQTTEEFEVESLLRDYHYKVKVHSPIYVECTFVKHDLYNVKFE